MADGRETYHLSDFTIVRKLGQGGFGSAYLARRNSDGLDVCLKKIPLRNGVSEQQIEREAKLLSELHDDHVIKYYGSFVESDFLYIVMAYECSGILLESWRRYDC